MRKAKQKHPHLRYALLLLGLMTVLPLQPWLYADVAWYVTAVLIAFAYLLFGWQMLAALGHCPLRWRKLAPWVLLIALSHAYWMEFLQGVIPVLQPRSSLYQLFAAAAGALGGIRWRLSYAYRHCDCSLSNALPGLSGFHQQQVLPPLSQYSGHDALHTHHPALPGIVAQSFGWKPMTISQPDWQLHLICTGRSMVSLPHFSYGAFFGEANVPDQPGALLEQLHFNKGFQGLEYRRPVAGYMPDALKVSSWLHLNKDVSQLMLSFSSNLRRKINKGYRHGMTVVSGKEELLQVFYSIYARHMHRLGSGAMPKRFFRNLLKQYNSDGGVATIYLLLFNGKAVGAAFNLQYRGFCENGWFATTPEAQKRYGSYVLHHAMITDAAISGATTYSFGRSTRDSGVHRFKHQWNTFDVPLEWLHYPKKKLQLRQQTWITNVWKRLPYPLARHVGRMVAKWVY